MGADTDEALVADVARLVAAGPDETAAQEVVVEIADRLGLRCEWYDEDLPALRAQPGYPGEEVDRERLVTVVATASGRDPAAPRLCLSGHVDVVPPGDRPWTAGPFDGRVTGGRLHGRGSADMRAGLVAALHAAGAARAAGGPPGDVVVHSVGAEEDGGLGAFAALCRDAAFAGCVIPEPTGGDIVCAHGGALTWQGRVTGRAAHACDRLSGVSALDRFLPIYRALLDLEAELNRDVAHPLMRLRPLPYPLSIGRLRAGDWPSTVPADLVFEGRVGVPVGATAEDVRRRLEAVVLAAADGRGEPPSITWTGGQFEPAQTPTDHPLVARLTEHVTAVAGAAPRLAGASYGSDMRLYTAHGVPTVMYGPGAVAQAHATDESVELTAVRRCARVLTRLALTFADR